MNSLPQISEKIKHPLHKIYSGLAAMTLIALITVTLSILATLAVPEARPVTRYVPGHPAYKVVMKRESLDLNEALNESLATGDYRRVNVNWEEVI